MQFGIVCSSAITLETGILSKSVKEGKSPRVHFRDIMIQIQDYDMYDPYFMVFSFDISNLFPNLDICWNSLMYFIGKLFLDRHCLRLVQRMASLLNGS